MAMELIVMEEKKPISISMMEEEEEYSEYSVESSEEEEEEDSDYDMDKSKNEPDEEDESDEEVICDRVEVDRGINYVVKDVGTVTRPEIAEKTYFRRKKCYPYRHELYHYKFPLSTFAKFALERYNHIEVMPVTCSLKMSLLFFSRRGCSTYNLSISRSEAALLIIYLYLGQTGVGHPYLHTFPV
ncbi:hypothetical protein POM88_005486 [Heracleum sosnowskyi]|uniref:Uncharacterized protein n=1 Tax=Heracleum sosnowskyi TaxID=360622 RepID=A0AAD8J2X4_9APIA|nr:hypothetical protein POM88_005486 [Heracleum sosnowskyi]